MSSIQDKRIQGQRIQANCAVIWGNGDYDLEIETDDWITYVAVVRRDLGLSFSSPLTLTGVCRSEEHAWRELDRMLAVWARVIQNGKPMTDDQSMEIFGGPDWRTNSPLRKLFARVDERMKEGATVQSKGNPPNLS